MTEVKRYSSDNHDVWNAFVLEAKNGHFIFLRSYMDYHADRFTDHSLVITGNTEKLIAILPASESNGTLYSHQGLTFGGLLTGTETKQTNVLEIFSAILGYLRKNGFEKLVYKRIPSFYQEIPSEEDLYALFLHDAKLVRRDVSSAIRTSNLIRYSKGRKWLVKKARKAGLELTKNPDLGEFWAKLEQVLLARHAVSPIHSLEEISTLLDKHPENIEVYSVSDGNSIVSGAVLYNNDKVCHVQYMFNTDRGREIGGLDFLIDEIINIKIPDVDYFDFGISTEDAGKSLNQGLIAQKEAFGARAQCYDWYEVKA